MPEYPPTLESPPPAPPAGPEEPQRGPLSQPENTSRSLTEPGQPSRIRTGRFGELDHHDLVHLLESLDTERERARFRESIYISLFVWLAIAWFAIYGPKVLFHQGTLVERPLQDRHKNELTYLETPKDLLQHAPPKPSKVISDQTQRQQTPHPTLDPKTIAELERMRRAGEQAAHPPAPKPAPQQPQPQQQRPTPPAPQPQQQPQPQPQQQAHNQPPAAPTPSPRSAIPDAPKPSPNQGNRPIFQQPSTNPGQSIANAARNAMSGRDSGDGGANVPSAHPGMNGAVDILSDTMGVDFGPYMRHFKIEVRRAWEPLIPDETLPPISKSGVTVIILRINKDGSIGGMKLEDSTHDDAINRAAWGAIVSANNFGPLPKEFTGPELDIRLTMTTLPAVQR